MHDIGHPIAGDKKYGAQTDPLHRLALHARVLAFRHPISGEPMRFETEIPRNSWPYCANSQSYFTLVIDQHQSRQAQHHSGQVGYRERLFIVKDAYQDQDQRH